ncbi:MAG: fumarylacetoacetate hydrolase family protein [Pseudomonadota bacterium]
MKLVVPVLKPTLAPISGSEAYFPIRRIFCVGRNYEAHAREMGKDPDRDPPFFFTKWPETFVSSGRMVNYPLSTENYHFEIELVVAISKGGVSIAASEARKHIYGYAVGLDMTRRDLQLVAREQGRPWDTGKNFAESAPIGLIHSVDDIGHIDSGRISLEVNGEVKQDQDVRDLIWSTDEIIEHLSRLYELHPGDLIMTGTPAGVGPVQSGDHLIGRIEGLSDLEVTIGSKQG